MRKRFTEKDIEHLQAKGIRAKEIAPSRRNPALIMENPPAPPNTVKSNTYLIGIDPDVEKCGVAIKDKTTDTIIEVKALHFFDVINLINRIKQDSQVIAYVDAGWLISKSNWHKTKAGKYKKGDDSEKVKGERIAKNVGACHQVGKLLCEYFSRKGIKYYPIKPTKSKVGPEAFKKLGVWKGRINQDQRDAVMLILGR